MSMQVLPQFLVNALIAGTLFALLGLSFGAIYSTSRILHFAHGGVYVIGAYAFFAAHAWLGIWLVPAALLAILASGVAGAAVMRLLYDPLLASRASGVIIMIASLGLFIVIENVIVLLFGNDSRIVYQGSVQAGYSLGGVSITLLQIYILLVSIAVFIATWMLATRTRLGRALRALADDAGMAEIIGLDVKRLRYVVFFFGSAILGVAAVLHSLDIGISPQSGLTVILIAAVAAIIGGANVMLAGILGGYIIGFMQNLGVLWIDPRWQNLITFAALVIVLVLRPEGLIARRR